MISFSWEKSKIAELCVVGGWERLWEHTRGEEMVNAQTAFNLLTKIFFSLCFSRFFSFFCLFC